MRISFDSKKRKLISQKNSQDPQDLSRKSSFRELDSKVLVGSRNQSSAQSLRNALEQVSVSWAREKEMRMELEEKVTKIYERGIQREAELQKLLQQTIPFCNNQRPVKLTHQGLKHVQKQLLDFFIHTNDMSNQKLADETQEIQAMMERKIKSITAYMEEELEKSKKMLKLNYETIRKEINRIIALGSAILDDNQTLRKEIDALKFRNAILKEEKDMLIVQVLQKKTVISHIYQELKRKYTKDDLLDEEIAILKRDRMDVELQYQRYQQQIRTKLTQQATSKFSQETHNKLSQAAPKHAQIHAKSILAFTIDQYTQNSQTVQLESSKKNTIEREDTYYSATITKPDFKHKKEQRLFTTVDTQKRTTSRVSSVANKTHSLSQSRAAVQKQDKVERVISSLKRELQNERKKSTQQMKKINKYQIYQKEMENMFGEQLLEKQTQDPQSNQTDAQTNPTKANAIKIQEIVKELGRRMLSTANPSVNSGYNDLENLLRDFQDQSNQQSSVPNLTDLPNHK